MNQEIIAKLVGVLKFDIDASNLIKFQRQLSAIQRQMEMLGRRAEKLNRQLSVKLGIKGNGNAEQTKLATEIARNQDKQLRREALLQRARRVTFAAELQQAKLIATGKREDVTLASAAVRLEQQKAVLAAKQSAAQAASLKAQGVLQRNEQSLLSAKARQNRLEELARQTAIKTASLKERHAQTLTRGQKLELALQAAREAGERRSQRYTASVAEAKLRAARQAAGADQRAQRFRFAEQRHAAWQAAQARKMEDANKPTLVNLPVAVGSLGAALYGATKILSYAQHRIDDRREQAADTQLFDNQLLAAGNTPDEQAKVRKSYIDNSQEFGMAINKDSAVRYGNQIQAFRAQGHTLDQALQLQKEQAQVFRIGALNTVQQESASIQLAQGYGRDRFLGNDLRPLTDALGGRLTNILYKAIGKALGYKGNQNQLAGFVLEQQMAGKVNAAMVQQGMRDIVAQSPELLERHKHSLDAQNIRIENDKYLRNDEINQNPELLQALTELNDSERDLIASNATLARAMATLDVGLAKLETGLFRLLVGKNFDGSAKTPAQVSEAVAGIGNTEGSAVDPSALTGQQVTDAPSLTADPIDRFYRFLFNKAPPKPEKDLDKDWGNFKPAPMFPGLEDNRTTQAPFENLQQLPMLSAPAMINFANLLGRIPVISAEDMQRDAQRRYDGYNAGAVPGALIPQTTNNNTTNAPTINVNNTFNVRAEDGALVETLEREVKEHTRSEIEKIFTSYLPKEVK